MKRSTILLFVMIFFVVFPVWADEPDWLGSIVVRKDSSFSGDQTKIGQQEITETTTSSNIAEVLSESSTHLVVDSNARRESQFKLHGFDQRQTVVMLDGVPVYLPYDGLIDLGNVGTEDISSVNVSEGIASVLYGPNAMGGVVNIETKKPDKPFSLTNWAEAGEHQTYYAGETLSLRQAK